MSALFVIHAPQLNVSKHVNTGLLTTVTGPWNRQIVAGHSLKAESSVFTLEPLPFALENRSVVDSKAYSVTFKALISIIFQVENSTTLLLYIVSSTRSNSIA